MKSSSLRAVFVAGACLGLTACAGPDEDSQSRTSQQHSRYLVSFAPGAAAQGRAAVQSAGGQVALDLPEVEAAAAYVPGAALGGLENNPNILSIEPDPKRYLVGTLDFGTPEFSPYGISMVQADLVADGSAANRTVCIIDSGYDTDHEDLPDARGCDSSEHEDCNLAWDDPSGNHGTHVAGTIAALESDEGVVGVLPGGNLDIYNVKVFDDSGWSYASNLISAAYRCRDAGADVISMSLGCAAGGPFCYSSAEDAAFADLYGQGILSVAAASNDGKGWYSYPASYDSVISVAAVDQNQDHAWFSNTNDQVELAAPGVGVYSTVPYGYEDWSGTSMATPHVSAVAALIWSYDTSLTAAEIREALTGSAKDLGSAGRDQATGYGLIQAQAALDYLGLGGPACTSDSDCSDGLWCNGEETCVEGACQGGTAPCDDGVSCTEDACDEETQTCENLDACSGDACNDAHCDASSDACVFTPVADGTTCDNGDACDGDTCQGGTCEPATCESDCDFDGVCDGDGENGITCPSDCRCAGPNCKNGNCGDGVCYKENDKNCPVDCA